jgi:hypothetical protein
MSREVAVRGEVVQRDGPEGPAKSLTLSWLEAKATTEGMNRVS